MKTYFAFIVAFMVATVALAQVNDLGQPLADQGEDGFILLVPARAEGVIETDLALAQEAQAVAQARVEEALHLVNLTNSRITQQKAEVERIKADKKMAETQKNEVEKVRHEERKKEAEMRLKLHEENRELRKKEREAAEAHLKMANTRVLLYTDEIKLATLRAQQRKIVESKDTASMARLGSLGTQIRTLEETILETFEKMLEREQEFVNKRKDAVSQRRTIFEQQQKIIGRK